MLYIVVFVKHGSKFDFERTVYFEYSLNEKHNVNVCYDIYSYVNYVVSIFSNEYCSIISF